MKKVTIVLALMISVVGHQLIGQQQVLDKVVAKVGSEVVLYSGIAEQLSLMKQQRGSVPEGAECLVLQSRMGSALLVNQARIDSVLVSPIEIEAQMDARMEQILGVMGNDLEMFQEVYGQTVTEMKNQVRDDMERKLLADRMQGQVMADASVTPSEVIAFFESIPKDSIPYFESEVEIGEIVYKPEINDEERAKALARINEIQDKLKNGEAFAELAATYSDDYASAREGGELGWNARGTFVPEFEAVAYKLAEDEISEPVESQFGFHIIQARGRRGNSINTRHILVKPSITEADLEKASSYLDSVRTLILSDSMTFPEAVKEFGNEKVQSYTNSGRMINPNTGNTFYEIRAVEYDIFFAIDTLETMSVTKPIQYRTQTGEPMFRIVQLQSRSAPHQASLKQDYSKIRDAAIESKKNEAFNDWIESTLESTFIVVDPHYQTCPNMGVWLKNGERT